jgi:hypothetical protein
MVRPLALFLVVLALIGSRVASGQSEGAFSRNADIVSASTLTYTHRRSDLASIG